MSPRPVRVLVADSDRATRDTLADIVVRHTDLDLVGVASSISEALAAAVPGALDVALVDVDLDRGRGDQLVRMLRGDSHVLAYAASAHRDQVVAMLRAGAVGYLTRDATAGDVVAALLAAADGHATISPAAAPAVVAELVDHLSAQERVLDEERSRLARVRRVLDEELIDTVFQPIFSLDTGEVDGYEALTRIPLQPVYPPDRWFAEAWRVGLGTELEVLAFRAALTHLDRLPPDTYLAVNVSPEVVASNSLAAELDTADAGRVVVELTEHAEVHDYDRLTQGLVPLRAAGARVSVDDTGAGFASLRHILRLEPEFIKLDGSITHNIDNDLARHALPRGLMSFADDINARIIGEGVETDAELETLRRLGVASVQGFLLGRPGPLPATNLRQ